MPRGRAGRVLKRASEFFGGIERERAALPDRPERGIPFFFMRDGEGYDRALGATATTRSEKAIYSKAIYSVRLDPQMQCWWMFSEIGTDGRLSD